MQHWETCCLVYSWFTKKTERTLEHRAQPADFTSLWVGTGLYLTLQEGRFQALLTWHYQAFIRCILYCFTITSVDERRGVLKCRQAPTSICASTVCIHRAQMPSWQKQEEEEHHPIILCFNLSLFLRKRESEPAWGRRRERIKQAPRPVWSPPQGLEP